MKSKKSKTILDWGKVILKPELDYKLPPHPKIVFEIIEDRKIKFLKAMSDCGDCNRLNQPIKVDLCDFHKKEDK